MKRSRVVLYLLFTDWLIMVGSFAVALRLRHYDPGMNIIPEMLTAMFYAFIMLGVFSMLELYKRKILLTPLQHFVGILKASFVTILIYILVKSILKSDLFIPSRLVLLMWGAILVCSMLLHRLVVFRLLFSVLTKTDMRRRVVVIGDTKASEAFIKDSRDSRSSTLMVIGCMDDVEKAETVTSVPFLGSPSMLPDLIGLYKLEGAVICNPSLTHQKLMDLVDQCIRLFGWVDVHSDKSTALQQSRSADAYFDTPFIRMHGIPNNMLFNIWKRIFDFAAALAGILLLSPILIGTAIAVKLTSPGPILYIKERVGRKGKPFPFYKFRSMVVGADHDDSRMDAIKDFIRDQESGEKRGKVVNTAYVTPVGKFIRKWAIDELPQLFNVLKGEMALVGPRPVPPSEYEHEDEWHRTRFNIDPGCTGLWKIYAAKTGVTFNDTVLYDIYYSRNMNPALDLMIIFSTIWIILSGKADG